ncbi:MAG: sugar-binding protein, partial [Gammaproteobacteria bacterium]|nr:sugar-binding protein [Gammaproteobacteria bacterium]
MSGIMADMDAVAQSLWAKDNNVQTSKAVGQQTGMIASAFEHRIPELFFINEENPGKTISAVKALAIAAQQGQRIYQITSANISVLDRLNIGAEVKDDIRAAAAVGKEAAVSEGTITVADWTGTGYIISDPATGAGAYRISGGSNGCIMRWQGYSGMTMG